VSRNVSNTPSDEATRPIGDFWRRQVTAPPTRRQTTFDVIFGILLPIICLYFDPGILRRYPPVFWPIDVAVFVYCFSAFAILALSVWLTLRPQSESLAGFHAGILLSAAICSFVIGVAIFPLTIVGIFLLVGFLGFVPFVTAFVYLRNGIRAVNHAKKSVVKSALIWPAVISGILVVGLPALAEWRVSRIASQSMNEILYDDSAPVEAATERFKYFRWLADDDKIMGEYERESSPEHKQRLAKAYKEITGQDLEDEIRRRRD
jgi:hypothetical protein